ncbi:MAG: PAS domain S-box protein [Proteobacteria bacterium]|nr:PAS domain S-box protein [Pseudomonadota bacterium]
MNSRRISLKARLNFVFLPLFLFFIAAVIVLNYFIVKDNIDEMIDDELDRLSNSVSINLETLMNSAMKKHLEGIAWESKSMAEDYYDLYRTGTFTWDESFGRVRDKLSSRRIGKNGGLFVVDIDGFPKKTRTIIEPDLEIEDSRLKSFVVTALENVEGYFEFTWSDPASGKEIGKFVYYVFVGKWNWVLFAISDRDEVKNLVDVEDISDDVLALKIGENGYASIMDMKGNLLVHPWNQNENVYDLKDAEGEFFIRKMIANRNGRLEYFWEYGEGVKKSVVYYRYIPDLKLIIWISTCLEDHYSLLTQSRNISLLILVLSILVIFPIVVFSGSAVTKPLAGIIDTFKDITENLNFKEVAVHGNKEVVELGSFFNVMIREIKRYHEELHSEIAERKAAQIELQEKEKRFRVMLEQLPLPMALSRNGKIEYLNRVFVRTFGYTLDDFPSEREGWNLVFPEEEYREKSMFAFQEKMRQAVDGEIFEMYTEKFKCRDGRILNVEFKIALFDETVLAVFNDVTEHRKAQEMIIQSEKMMTVGGLAAGMAHEINNPLGGIMQGIQTSLNRLSPDLKRNRDVATKLGVDIGIVRAYLEERKIIDYMEGMREASHRAARIVANMLQFARKSESIFARTDLNVLIENTIEIASKDYDLKAKYDFRKVSIVRDYQKDLPPVNCIETEIEQVVFNLLKNSSQAMADITETDYEPQITIRTAKEGDQAVVSIADNGPGIEDDKIRNIFEPFYTTKKTGVGTGLGLSVSYYIVTNNHKGTLTVRSEPGERTEFTLKIPI